MLRKGIARLLVPVMLLTMLVIRHKTRKPKFMVGIPLILLLQVAAAVVLWKVFYA